MSVTNVVHDHTSVLATIEAKWNLPAMTYRDANAATMADFLAPSVTFPEAPKLTAPSNLGASEKSCDSSALKFTAHPGAVGQRLFVSYHVRPGARGIVVKLHTNFGTYTHLVVVLRRGKHVVARAHVRRVGTTVHRLVLHPSSGMRFARGHYELVVRHHHERFTKRGVVVG